MITYIIYWVFGLKYHCYDGIELEFPQTAIKVWMLFIIRINSMIFMLILQFNIKKEKDSLYILAFFKDLFV